MESEGEKLYYVDVGLTNYYRVGVYAKDVLDARVKAAVKVKRDYETMQPMYKRPEITYIDRVYQANSVNKGGRPRKHGGE